MAVISAAPARPQTVMGLGTYLMWSPGHSEVDYVLSMVEEATIQEGWYDLSR